MFQSRLSVFLGAYTVIGIAVDFIAFAKSLDAQTGFTDAAGPTILVGAIWPVTVFVKILDGF